MFLSLALFWYRPLVSYSIRPVYFCGGLRASLLLIYMYFLPIKYIYIYIYIYIFIYFSSYDTIIDYIVSRHSHMEIDKSFSRESSKRR